MDRFYISKIHIQKVRHLENIDIDVVPDHSEMRHLILTGKNGSGKTSLLEALRTYLNSVSLTNDPYEAEKGLEQDRKNLQFGKSHDASQNETHDVEKRIVHYEERIAKATGGLDLEFSLPKDSIRSSFEGKKFILSYFGATRKFESLEPKHIEKTVIKDYYAIDEKTSAKFLSYLLDLKMTQALALAKKDTQKSDEIERWFVRLQDILRDIYDDPTLQVVFDEDTFKFSLLAKDRVPFDFNTASDGFSAILDVIVDLMIRMQSQGKRETEYQLPGIVLIDEIENHLHIELQRRVLRILTTLFPNIQFIVTTHSPFILNSVANATIFDLEHQKIVRDGLADASYSGIVEGYFNQDELSEDLRRKLENYRFLTRKKNLSDDDYVQLALLETSLDEIPDYIDIGVATEYRKMKTEFALREAQR